VEFIVFLLTLTLAAAVGETGSPRRSLAGSRVVGFDTLERSPGTNKRTRLDNPGGFVSHIVKMTTSAFGPDFGPIKMPTKSLALTLGSRMITSREVTLAIWPDRHMIGRAGRGPDLRSSLKSAALLFEVGAVLRRIAITSDALHRFLRYGVAAGGVTSTDYAPAHLFLNRV